MKKILSLILSTIMLVALSLSLFACGGDDNQGNNQGGDEKKLYTVTVVDDEGNPVEKVEVTFFPAGAMEMPWDTDANGKASYKTNKELTAKVTEVPMGYKFDSKEIEFDDNGNATVTITKMPPYVVKVVDQEGNPVADVSVQMCSDLSCVPFAKTDENGETSRPYAEGDFRVNITGLPEGYTVDDLEAYYDFEDGQVTIKVTKIG